jgi:hypothetical protein
MRYLTGGYGSSGHDVLEPLWSVCEAYHVVSIRAEGLDKLARRVREGEREGGRVIKGMGRRREGEEDGEEV